MGLCLKIFMRVQKKSMKLRKNFLIYCKDSKFAGHLKHVIYQNIQGICTYISLNQDNTYQILLNKRIDVFLVEMDPFHEKDKKFLEDVYFHLKNLSAHLIILTAEEEEPQHFSLSCHSLQKPIQTKKLIELLLKLSSRKKIIRVQGEKRHRTRQEVYVKSLLKKESFYKINMYNLSKTGSYFEMEQLPPWNVGETVGIKVNLKDLSIQHELIAKVMWINNEGSIFGGHGMGVKFISSHSLHSSLIEETEALKERSTKKKAN